METASQPASHSGMGSMGNRKRERLIITERIHESFTLKKRGTPKRLKMSSPQHEPSRLCSKRLYTMQNACATGTLLKLIAYKLNSTEAYTYNQFR